MITMLQKKIDIKDLNKQINIEKNRHDEEVVYDDEDDDDYYEEEKPKYKKEAKK